jgi:hypothetical protein
VSASGRADENLDYGSLSEIRAEYLLFWRTDVTFALICSLVREGEEAVVGEVQLAQCALRRCGFQRLHIRVQLSVKEAREVG